MNRSRVFIIFILVFLLCTMLLVSCNKKHEDNFTVVFDGNGGTLIEGKQTQTVSSSIEIRPPQYERHNYSFIGWSIDPSIISDNATISAVWQRVYTVTFDGNGGTLEDGNEIQKVAFGEPAFAPLYEKDGYLLSWDNTFDSITANKTIKAVWTRGYTVIFNGNGGTHIRGVDRQIVAEGSSAVAPVFEKDEYSLSWDKAFDNINSDITINAIWTIKEYTVTFRGNGGQLHSGERQQVIKHGNSAVAPNYIKEGYNLAWDKPFYNIIDNTIISAIWTRKIYTIIFDGNGGVLQNGQTKQHVEHGGIALAPTFIMDGYRFVGWDKDLNNITESTTIIAQWQRI